MTNESSDTAFRARLAVCRECEDYCNSVNHGACKLLRDSSGRVRAALLTQVLFGAKDCPAGRHKGVGDDGRDS